jgi:hypothetical protein
MGLRACRMPLLSTHAFARQLLGVQGVVTYSNARFWQHTDDVVVGTVHVQVADSASESRIRSAVTAILRRAGIDEITVQVVKEEYYRLTGEVRTSRSGSEGAVSRAGFSIESDIRMI